MKRILTIILLSLAAVSLLCANGSKEQGETKPETTVKTPEKPVTVLNFWSWRTEDVEIYNALINIFKSRNPDIDVKFTAYKNTEYNTVLSAAMKGQSGPDIIHLKAYGGLETYAQPGYLMPLGDKIPELAKFSETALGGVTSISDGKKYGVPFASQTLVIYYNKKIYAELGLTPPETWSEFLANLKAVKSAGYTALANGGKDGWTLEVLQGAICPNFYGANTFFNEIVSGKAKFTDPRYKSSLDKLLELKPYMADNFMGVGYTDTQMMFINEMAGHFIGGSWEAGYFNAQNPDLDFDIFAGPVARKGDTPYVSTFVDGSFGMSATTKAPEAATRFLRFMASTEAGQFLADKLLQKSDVPGVVFSDPFLERVGALNKNSTPYIMLVGFRYEQPTGSALIASSLQGMLGGSINSAEVVRQVQEGVATWYKPFQK